MEVIIYLEEKLNTDSRLEEKLDMSAALEPTKVEEALLEEKLDMEGRICINV